ncbi:LysE family translocator [Pseudogulbenkiania subflava]|uniref:Threonine/homoserine/homoserine lactone efflux protein n=1 Tax=Pseudogulbenkiania subflava DSM 22618 TaxID=1123014 RepID=A0A1Y6BC75_9NEIS|nr:LysE family translocator [Pseudogulbenkiania subflava]SME96146.1 Threonine/homoserine/homoserine lactone efflux protein [Pseudogulbenkiania subflava DSM 22618]
MIGIETLGLFLLSVMLLLLSPGPNMAFLLSYSTLQGARAGYAVALGILLADVVLTLLTAGGVTAMLMAWPPLFDALRLAGAAYLVWLAWKAWRSGGLMALAIQPKRRESEILRMAMFNSLLNPKALLFFMVFLPQFVNASQGHVGWQLCQLGAVLTLAAFLFHALLGRMAASVSGWLTRQPGFAVWQGRVLAIVLLGLAARLLLLQRPAQG